ncbi:hypothetical protein WKK05_34205 [Nostoc sp. UHCC 0302]|uniref:hypothetical protein n=1 Tax=Nostoc sp. UHCC 0302 TaxID=3134896 RepID=UPI00311CDEEF
MLAQFQSLYPNGSLISELVQIFQGKYIVRASVQVEGVTRATGLAAAETVEAAEDQARTRALLVLGIANAPQESVALSSTPISKTQINPTSSTNSSGQDKDFLSSQWSVVSGKEISPPPLNERNIKPEPITTDYVNTPAVSQKLELTTDKGNVNTSDTYSQDLGQEFRVANQEIPFDTPVEKLEIISGNQAENQPLLGISASNVTPFTPRNYNPQEDAIAPTSTGRKKKKSEPVDLSDVIAKTDVELQRLGWTPEQGREHLIKTYGKRGRTLLTEDELHGFLQYLQSQPDPIAGF